MAYSIPPRELRSSSSVNIIETPQSVSPTASAYSASSRSDYTVRPPSAASLGILSSPIARLEPARPSSAMINEIHRLCLEHIILLKTFHFQTTKHTDHQLIDCYLKKFTKTYDKLMEASQGVYGRITSMSVDIKVSMVNEKTIAVAINEFKNALIRYTTDFERSLISIVDSIVIEINTLLYLLSLQV